MLRLAVLLAALLAVPAAAQPNTTLYPDQKGSELLTSVRGGYTPSGLLSESQSKDRMVDPVWREADNVVGAYTGEIVPFDGSPTSDRNQDIFNNGRGLNQEHVWPRSELGGSSSVSSERDLHHLFPTDVETNGDRGSLPFCNLADSQVDRWFGPPTTSGGDAHRTGSDPAESLKPFYSRVDFGNCFEVRDDIKGDVARAMFYVAALYPSQANMSFFSTAQRQVLYGWHYADLPSQEEYDRTLLIEVQQGNRNPFVLDSTLIRRAFFPEITVNTEGTRPAAARLALDGPNPFTGTARLTLTLAATEAVTVAVYDALGRRVAVLHEGPVASGTPLGLTWDARDLPAGVYLVRAQGGGLHATLRLTRAD